MIIRKTLFEHKEIPSDSKIVLFNSLSYQFTESQAKEIDRLHHLRAGLLKKYPIGGGYYFRRCLQVENVITIPVKSVDWGSVTQKDIEQALTNLCSYCRENNLRSLVFAKQACSEDVDWLYVYNSIRRIFEEAPVEIYILSDEKAEMSKVS